MNKIFDLGDLLFDHNEQDNIRFYQKERTNWDGFLDQTFHAPIYYSYYFNCFQNEILKGKTTNVKDLSFEILWNNNLVGIFPIKLITSENYHKIAALEGHLLPVLYKKGIPIKICKQIDSILIKKLVKYSEQFQNIKLSFLDQIVSEQSLTNWHKLLLKNSFKCHIQRESFVNLSWDYSEIKKNYRKSYKSLISKGKRLWNLKKLTKNDESKWDEFRNLHLKSAGRKTRSDKSWDILYESIINKNSTLYYCSDEKEKMVGGALIMLTPTEAMYAIAAYDRSLFDLPIGHSLQDFIIKDLKSYSNLKWYRLGKFHNINDFIKPSEKEISIGSFKKGFSTHLITNFIFN